MCIVFVLDGIFRPEKWLQHNNNECVLYLYLTEYSGRKVDTTQQQWMCIVFALDGIFRPERMSEQYMYMVFIFDGIFRPESWYNTTTMNVYCICIGRNIPAGKWIEHINNNQCVLYLYLTEYSGRKVKVINKCILYLYLTEYSGRKVDTTQQQWMCIVFVLDRIFRPESKSEQLHAYCICI